MSIFVGRNSEIEVAKGQLRQPSSRILVINGRRRIGKSTLAEKIAEGYKFFRVVSEKVVGRFEKSN